MSGNLERSEIRSGRGDGIAPVTPPTPPDMRFSRIRRLAQVDISELHPRGPPGVSRQLVIQRVHSRPSARPIRAAHGWLVRRNPPAAPPSAAALCSRPFGRPPGWHRSPAASLSLCAFGPSLQPLSRPSKLLWPLLTSAPLSADRSPRVRCMDFRDVPPDSTRCAFR